MIMKRANQGFSYVEVMIVLVLVVMASLGGVMQLGGGYRAHRERAAAASMLSALRDASARSIAQQSGKQWGVRFENFPTGDRYVFFSASSSALVGFVTSSVSYLPGTAQFSEGMASSTVIFEKLSGRASFVGCPSGTASTTIAVGTRSVRIYCNGKIE